MMNFSSNKSSWKLFQKWRQLSQKQQWPSSHICHHTIRGSHKTTNLTFWCSTCCYYCSCWCCCFTYCCRKGTTSCCWSTCDQSPIHNAYWCSCCWGRYFLLVWLFTLFIIWTFYEDIQLIFYIWNKVNAYPTIWIFSLRFMYFKLMGYEHIHLK